MEPSAMTSVSASTVEVTVTVDGDAPVQLMFGVSPSMDGTIVTVRPPDSLRGLVGGDIARARPVFDAIVAFWRAAEEPASGAKRRRVRQIRAVSPASYDIRTDGDDQSLRFTVGPSGEVRRADAEADAPAALPGQSGDLDRLIDAVAAMDHARRVAAERHP
jgi:hypothetical protein